ncbi:unnamed protein product [Sympodiomycopsis kandeliae]
MNRQGPTSSQGTLESSASNHNLQSAAALDSQMSISSQPAADSPFQPAPLEAMEEGDEDGGVIRCICGINDDDGFTIQCDRCLVWQHCACFGMSSQSVPDVYYCELCQPREVDVAFAQAHQQHRRQQEARKAAAYHHIEYSETQSPTASSAGQEHQRASIPLTQDDNAHHNGPSPPLPPMEHPTRQSASHQGRPRKPSQTLDLSNTSFATGNDSLYSQQSPGHNNHNQAATPSLTSTPIPPAKPPRKKPGPKPGSRRTPLATPTSASSASRGFTFPTPTPRDEKPEHDPLTTNGLEKLEAWQFDYTPIHRNLLAEHQVIDAMVAAMMQYEQGSPLTAQQAAASGHFVAPIAQDQRETSPLKAAAHDAHDETMTGDQQDWSGDTTPSHSHNQPQPGISPVGNECVPVEIRTPSLSAIASPVYVRVISEAASSAIFANVGPIIPLPNEPARPWSASKHFSRPIMHGLFAEDAIPQGAFIAEYRGELLSASTYRQEPINQYHAMGATKPQVHLLPPPLNLAIDARRFGTEARFARSGCHPNSVLRPILHYRTKPASDDAIKDDDDESRAATPTFTDLGSGSLPDIDDQEPELVFGIFALRDISRSHEIILGWEWDDQHIAHFLPELVNNPSLETPGSDRSASALEMVERGEFPYASKIFSDKMNAATTALLSSTLCSCIGSATPQSGSGAGSASSQNARKQDCAVLQMLRVGQGMGLMNVNIPGTTKLSQRRPRPPYFGPLIGVRRWWRPIDAPLTPISATKEHDDESSEPLSLREQILSSGQLPVMLAPGGKVERVMEHDLLSAMVDATEHDEDGLLTEGQDTSDDDEEEDDDAALTASEGLDIDDQDDNAVEAAHQMETPLTEAQVGDEDDTVMDLGQEHDGDTDVSSLTEPLSGLSDLDSDEDDSMLLFPETAADVSADKSEDRLPTILPLKKRVVGTRLKANHIYGDDPDREDKTNSRNAKKAERAAATMKAREAKAAKRRKTITGKRGPGRPRTKTQSSSEKVARHREMSSELSSEESDERAAAPPPRPQRRKGKKKSQKNHPALPSSPLTSAPEGKSSMDESESDPDRNSMPSRQSLSHAKAALVDSSDDDGDDDDDDTTAATPTSELRKVSSARNRPSKALGGPSRKVQSDSDQGDDDDDDDDDGCNDERDTKQSLGAIKRKKGSSKAKRAERRRNELAALADTDSSPASGSESPLPSSKKRKMTPQKALGTKKSSQSKHNVLLRDTDSEEDRKPEVPPSVKPVADPPAALPQQSDTSADMTTATVPTPEVAEPVPEPEKPRAKLSLADWKRQQAEKKKAAAEAEADQPSTGAGQGDSGPTSSAYPPPPIAIKTDPELPATPSVPTATTAVPLQSGDQAESTTGTQPSGSASLKSSLPPMPLPSRSPSQPDSRSTAAVPPPPLAPAAASPTSDAQTALPRPASFLSPPLPVSAKSTSMAAPAARVVSPGSAVSPTSPSAPAAPSSARLPPPLPSPKAAPPSGPALPSPLPPTSVPARPTGPRGRAPSFTVAGAQPSSAKSPPTAPAALVSQSPPLNTIDSGWSGRPSSHHSSSSMSSSAAPTSQSFRPVGRWSVSGPSGPSFSNTSSGAVPATSPVLNARPISPTAPSSMAGPSRFAEPPSPRNRPMIPTGPLAAAPAAPAALRGGSATSGVGSTNASAVPFNPPKGPKALMNPSAGGGAPGASGSNAISIRSASVTSAGSPPTNPAELPSGPAAASGPRGRQDRSPSSPPVPMRHLSILGRGAAAAAAAAAATTTTSSSDNPNSKDGSSMSVSPTDSSSHANAFWDRPSRERDNAGDDSRDGERDRWHAPSASMYDSHRGGHHHGHGMPSHHFSRGGWGGRGRGGSSAGNIGGGGGGGGGWGGMRGRGRGRPSG